MRNGLLIIFLFLFIQLQSQQEKKMDSLRVLLDTSANDSVKALAYYDLALEYLNIDFSKVIEYCQASLELARKTNNQNTEGNALRILGSVYADLGNNNKALDYLENAYDIFKNTGNNDAISRTLNNIGSIYWFSEEYNQALRLYRKSINAANEAGNIRVAQGVEMNIGLIYLEKEKYDSALYYMQHALDVARKNDYKYSIGLTLMNIGDVYLKQGNPDKALQTFTKVFDNYLEELTPPLRMAIHYSIAKAHISTGNYKKAMHYLDMAEGLPKDAIGLFILRDYYDTKFQLDTLAGNYNQAVNNLLMKNAIADSIEKQQFRHDLANFQVKFETRQKEKENKILRNSLELEKIKNQKRNFLLIIIILSLLFTLLIILIIYNQYRIKKQANETISDQNQELHKLNRQLQQAIDTKNKFFSIVAHDIKNPFGTIMGFTELIHNKYNQLSEEAKQKYIASLYKSSKNTFNFLQNLLIWARTQTDSIEFDPVPIDLNALIEQSIDLYQQEAQKKEIRIEFDAHPIKPIEADSNMIRTVINNLMINAIKFTHQQGLIIIRSTQSDFGAEFSIEDNGEGMTAKQIENLFKPENSISTKGTNGETGTGLGLILCDEFIKLHQGTINVASTKGEGSIFTVKIPE